jgi:hypothetical protein
VIPITPRQPMKTPESEKEISYCWTFGARRTIPEGFITTLAGLALWAGQLRIAFVEIFDIVVRSRDAGIEKSYEYDRIGEAPLRLGGGQGGARRNGGCRVREILE